MVPERASLELLGQGAPGSGEPSSTAVETTSQECFDQRIFGEHVGRCWKSEINQETL